MPNWEQAQPHTLAQWQARQRRLELAERQKQLTAQQEKQAEQDAEQTEINKQAARPVIKPPEPLPKKDTPPIKPPVPQGTTAPKTDGFSITDLGGFGWLIVGGIIIGLGIAVAIVKGTSR